MKLMLVVATACVGLLFASQRASAEPVSSCTFNGGVGFTCNVYESDANGMSSEISSIFALPNPVVAGYIVLLEFPTSLESDNTQWSDVLQFIDDGAGRSTSAQLFSDGCNDAAAPVSCFPAYATVISGSHAFVVETQTGTGDDFIDATVYDATNVYNIFSGAPVNEDEGGTMTPEPASIALLGSGLAGLVLMARRRKR